LPSASQAIGGVVPSITQAHARAEGKEPREDRKRRAN